MRTKIFQVILAIVSITLLFSCSSVKQANKFMDKAFKADTPTTVNRVRAVFPCINTGTTSDSAAYKAFMDSINNINDFFIEEESPDPATPDTMILPWEDSTRITQWMENAAAWKRKANARQKQIDSLNYKIKNIPPVHDQVKVKDTAEVYVLQKSNADKDAKIIKLTAHNESKLHWIFGLAIVLAISIIGNILLIKSKL